MAGAVVVLVTVLVAVAGGEGGMVAFFVRSASFVCLSPRFPLRGLSLVRSALSSHTRRWVATTVVREQTLDGRVKVIHESRCGIVRLHRFRPDSPEIVGRRTGGREMSRFSQIVNR